MTLTICLRKQLSSDNPVRSHTYQKINRAAGQNNMKPGLFDDFPQPEVIPISLSEKVEKKILCRQLLEVTSFARP